MSTEKIMYEEKNQTLLNTPVPSEVKFTGRVDINHLIARARKEKEKENKINLFFFGMVIGLIIVVGIILSF